LFIPLHKVLRLLLALGVFLPQTLAWSEPAPKSSRETVIVQDFFPAPMGTQCSTQIQKILIRSQRYNVWPDWYVRQRLGPHTAVQDWQTILNKVPETQLLVQGNLQGSNHLITVNLIVAQQTGKERTLIFANSQTGKPEALESICQDLAYQILGEPPEAPLRSPGLAASLSLIMPGAGHFYQGKPANILLGTGFLAGYVGLAYLGLSPQEEGGLTRQQWGGLLLLLSLTDILMAYFFSLPDPNLTKISP